MRHSMVGTAVEHCERLVMITGDRLPQGGMTVPEGGPPKLVPVAVAIAHEDVHESSAEKRAGVHPITRAGIDPSKEFLRRDHLRGFGFIRTEYGFRRDPYASEIRMRVGYSTGAQSAKAELEGDFHPENTARFWRIRLLASGVEMLRFYGLGNNSPNLGNSDFYRISQQLYAFEPSLVIPIGRRANVSIGATARWSRTGDNTGRLIGTLRDTLLGGRDFGELGGRVAFDLDTRDRPVNPLHGIHLSVAGEVHPGVWDVPNTFGAAQAEAAAFVSARMPGTPTLALHAGGRKVWGSFPFFDAAFLGGESTLAGYHSNRFAGDASLYGGGQLRLTMGRAFLALPASSGCFWERRRRTGLCRRGVTRRLAWRCRWWSLACLSRSSEHRVARRQLQSRGNPAAGGVGFGF